MINSVTGINTNDLFRIKNVELFNQNQEQSTIEANINQFINDNYDASADNKNNVRSEANKYQLDTDSKNKEKKDKVDYKELANNLKELAGANNVYFEFVMEEESKEMVMRVVDENTKEVIRQYPSEITLKIAKIVNETLGQGQITNVKI